MPICIDGFSQETTSEVWPEIDVFYRFNDKFELFALASVTQMKEESYYSDGSLGLHLDYFAYPFVRKDKIPGSKRGDYIWFRAGYIYAASTDNSEDVFKDNVIVTEANIKHHLPAAFLLTVKNRLDWKISNSTFSLRYRPKATFEHDFKTAYLTFTSYVYGEYFFDFNTEALNRLRLCLGSEVRVTKNINFELYYLYQFHNGASIPNVEAVGIAFKLYVY